MLSLRIPGRQYEQASLLPGCSLEQAMVRAGCLAGRHRASSSKSKKLCGVGTGGSSAQLGVTCGKAEGADIPMNRSAGCAVPADAPSGPIRSPADLIAMLDLLCSPLAQLTWLDRCVSAYSVQCSHIQQGSKHLQA